MFKSVAISKPIFSKIAICVCAAGTGAAIVPAAHVAQKHFAPPRALHRIAKGPLLAAAVRPDCLPVATTSDDSQFDDGGGLLTSFNAAPTPAVGKLGDAT